jgi:N-acetylglutamate synthase-like GNAT family acetyltransferase
MRFRIRRAKPDDIGAIDTLLQRSYPRLLKPDYPASVLVTALPRMIQAQPALIASGTYYVAESDTGDLLGAGGWTAVIPGQGGQKETGRGNIRHVVTDPDAVRQGVARAILYHSFSTAQAAGLTWLHCMSTRTAVPFYEAVGFTAQGEIVVTMAPGVSFPAIAMTRALTPAT